MKIAVSMPTRALNDPLIVAGCDYLKKVRHPFSAGPLFTSPKKIYQEDQALERMEAEGAPLLAITKGYHLVALSENGALMNSKEFAKFLQELSLKTQKTAFIIGGACGLAPHVIKACQKTISLSPMTLPHRLAFMLLSEQLYRACEILRGSPYHK